jgi:hypothetical protein
MGREREGMGGEGEGECVIGIKKREGNKNGGRESVALGGEVGKGIERKRGRGEREVKRGHGEYMGRDKGKAG